ncbi:MAG: AMP-binding protein [Acuticoccus sp.]
MSDLFAPVERNAAFTPDKAALHFEGETVSYAALVARVRRVAAGLLRAGVGPGDRIALLAHNHPDHLALLYAAARLGAILTPLNWRLAHEELAYAMGHAAPAILAHGPGFEDEAARLAPAARLRRIGTDGDLAADDEASLPAAGDPAAPALMVYTSGTTGRPKGALLSSAALLANAVQSQHMHQMTAADHILTVLPMFHVGGLNIQLTPALSLGATATLHARFDPAATLTAIAADRPTLTVLVPATMAAILAQPDFATTDFSSLRAIATGSTIVPERLIAAIAARGPQVLCVYGATETCPIAAYDRAGVPRQPGGTGRPGVLTDLAILDDAGAPVAPGAHGEIAVAGAILSGYFDAEAETRAAMRGRHFLTGDIGSLGPDGTLTVHERKKNMIVSGGENIYPAEVERALSAHPGVAACAVVGKADPRWQEVPVAFVVPRGAVSVDALVAHMSGLLARYKVPRDVRFLDALPLTALGKVEYGALRDKARTASTDPLASGAPKS